MNKDNTRNLAIAAGSQEIVNRYGSVGAEFLKGLRGIDYETGRVFDRGLMKISQYKVNPDFVELNIQQQAGFSAEVAYVAQQNAEAIISGNTPNHNRSEDVAGYGANHNVVDIVEVTPDGQQITAQMKFVNNPTKLLDNIVKGRGKNDLSRYLDADKLLLPTEQVQRAQEYCQEQADALREKAKLLEQNGKPELAAKYRAQAERYEQLKNKITDSGISSEEARRYRLNPKWETTKDILSVSHRAGIQGAKFGAAIGGSISLITNAIAVHSGNKEFSDALIDTSKDTLKSAGVGYVTAFAGSAVKGVMQQSSSLVIRNLSKSGLPAMIVSVCSATFSSISQYAKGEIDEVKLLQDMGAVVTQTLSTATFSMLGQIAIPIPVLGGLIGGMIGSTVTNMFYQSFLSLLNDAKESEERYQLISMQCFFAELMEQRYQKQLNELIENKLKEFDEESKDLIAMLNNESADSDKFCLTFYKFSEYLGKPLEFKNTDEFETFITSGKPLIL